VYCLKQYDLTVIAEIQIPKNNTAIVHLSEELQYRLAAQLNEPRLFNRVRAANPLACALDCVGSSTALRCLLCSQTTAYIEYRHPISLHLWAALMHYQSTEDQLDDLIVDQVIDFPA
jgi:hypothetical protein